MSRRGSTSFALLSGLITSAIPVWGEAENIQVVQIPIVTDARIEFFRLPWPATHFVAGKVPGSGQFRFWRRLKKVQQHAGERQ